MKTDIPAILANDYRARNRRPAKTNNGHVLLLVYPGKVIQQGIFVPAASCARKHCSAFIKFCDNLLSEAAHSMKCFGLKVFLPNVKVVAPLPARGNAETVAKS